MRCGRRRCRCPRAVKSWRPRPVAQDRLSGPAPIMRAPKSCVAIFPFWGVCWQNKGINRENRDLRGATDQHVELAIEARHRATAPGGCLPPEQSRRGTPCETGRLLMCYMIPLSPDCHCPCLRGVRYNFFGRVCQSSRTCSEEDIPRHEWHTDIAGCPRQRNKRKRYPFLDPMADVSGVLFTPI